MSSIPSAKTYSGELACELEGAGYYSDLIKPKDSDYVPDELEQRFIYFIVERGMSAVDAHIEAGYSPKTAPTNATKRRARLAPQIHKALQSRMVSGATLAVDTLIGFLSDESVSHNVRLKAATELLDRSGYAKRVEIDLGIEHRAIDEMSKDEIRERIKGRLKDTHIVQNKTQIIDVTAETVDVD